MTNPVEPAAAPREAVTQLGSYAVADHGAHVTRWSSGALGDLLYLSSTARFGAQQAIRGGVPICFPWFANGPGGDLQPSHGFARTATWRRTAWSVEQQTGVLVSSHELGPDDVAGRPGVELFPHRFTARYDVVLAPEHARFTLRVTNYDEHPFEVEAALHTYLRVSDIAGVVVDGLDGARYADKTAGGAERTQRGAVELGEEVDRVYESTGDVVVRDEGMSRVLRVSKLGSGQTVVWNPGEQKASALADVGPGEWRSFVCIEAAATGTGRILLAPGEHHELEQQIFAAAL